MLNRLLKLLDDVFLLRRDPVHDFEVPVDALDLSLQLTLLANIQERYDQVAETVVDVCVRQSREYPGPFPVLLRAKGVLGCLQHLYHQYRMSLAD